MSDLSKRIQGLSAERLRLLAQRLKKDRPDISGATIQRQSRESMYFPLSRAQERLWFIDQMTPGTAAYNLSISFRYDTALNVEAMSRTLNELVRRHETLRTTFEDHNGSPAQVVHSAMTISLPLTDLRDLSQSERERKALLMAEEEACEPFDLKKGPLLRAKVICLGEQDYVLLWSVHHIVFDGSCGYIFPTELHEVYEAFCDGRSVTLPELPIQYVDYVVWQRDRLRGERHSKLLDYWRSRLSGVPVLDLPTDYPRPPVYSYRGGRESMVLSREMGQALNRLSRESGTTLFMTLLAAFQLLLSRYSGQNDIAVGTPVANRNQIEVENVIGMFVNTLVLRTNLEGHPTFRELLGRVRQICTDAYANQELPFEEIVRELNPHRNLGHQPLFQAMFHLNSTQASFRLQDDHCQSLPQGHLWLHGKTALFDLTLTVESVNASVRAEDDALNCLLEYSADLFDATTIRRMTRHFQVLLRAVVEKPEQPVDRLPLLDEDERRQVLVDGTGMALALADVCIHELFEQQAEKTPQAVAVKRGDKHLTYSELNHRANQLAHYLRRLGAGPEVVVGIFLERSLEMLVALLGVLKAGSAYVPLDPAYPEQRLRYMLENSEAAIVLTCATPSPSLATSAITIVRLDSESDTIAQESQQSLERMTVSGTLAYVLYTSGSSGEPKGVAITHGNAVNLIVWAQREFSDAERAGVLAGTSLGFDLSIFELWTTLCCGGMVHLAENALELASLEAAHEITLINTVPSAMSELVAMGKVPSLARTVNLAGEPLPEQLVKRIFRDTQVQRVNNLYGPTETTTYSTFRVLRRGDKGAPTIGGPIGNTQVYVLDKAMEAVPVGVTGELYIGGRGLARGYLNRPDLTAERFLPHGLSQQAGERLYRTGDKVRWRVDGELEYIGRLDHQVKIRGFRIELGEIESRLIGHPHLREAVVITSSAEGGDRQLIAYYVPSESASPTVNDLRSFLGQQLPNYMIPSAFVELPALPRTANGKLDRRALPLPGLQRPNLAEAYEAPRTPAEQTLSDIWKQILGVAQVGVHDNFFSLGGDSIRSLQVLSLAAQKGLRFTLQQLFQNQTIRELANVALTGPFQEKESIRPFALVAEDDKARIADDVEDAYPLLTMQAGMLFHSSDSLTSAIYHDIFSYHLKAPFSAGEMCKALDDLCRRHAVLRTSFDLSTFSEPLQLVHKNSKIQLQIEDWRAMDPAGQKQALAAWMESEKARPFDWIKAPLLRVCIHLRSDETFQLAMTFHHAILDGWSTATMFTELFQSYFRAAGPFGREPLAAPETVMRDFVAAEKQILDSEESQKFWSRQIEDCTVAVLPRRVTEPAPTQRVGVHELSIPPRISSGLAQLAQSLGMPEKNILLAVHMRVLGLASGQTDVLSGVLANSRPEVTGGDLALGLFLNVVPFRLRLGSGTWLELIRKVDQIERQIFPHRAFPMAAMQRNWHAQPLFEVVFNFVHFHVAGQLSDLPQLEMLEGNVFEETNFPLFVEFSRDPLTLNEKLSLRYDPLLLEPKRIETIAGYYERALYAVVSAPGEEYAAAPLLSEKEMRRLLVELNDSHVSYPAGDAVHTLFESQAERFPDRTALVCGKERLSYSELNRRANQLAHHLLTLGAGRESRISVLMRRSANMVIAMLGILKAGSAYVPLDPAYPTDRLNYMAQDATTSVLVSEGEFNGLLQDYSGCVVSLDSDGAAIASKSIENPMCPVLPENVAYVIYTSGSTGRPKGTAIEHRSAVTLLRWAADVFTENETAGVLASTSICFDLSIFELFLPLSRGGKVILVENLLHLSTLAAASEVTLINTVPSVMAELVRSGGVPSGVCVVNLAGEALPHSLVEQIYQVHTVKKVYNLYGPSEDTTYSTFTLVHKGDPRPPTIGRPVANTKIYLLDPLLRLVPEGVIGELYIAGDGLARGYIDRPDQTAERFLPDPFGKRGERMYRTGDLASYRANGSLEYLGRIDHQVKLRGFRIELGEIEYLLCRHPGLSDAVVVMGDSAQGKCLIAYLVSRNGAAPEAGELRAYLREMLPEHMVPSAFVMLQHLPVTPNGKVDRRALPALELAVQESERAAAPPTTPIAQMLAGIWEQVLHVRNVELHDNFFQLGGHSLLAMQVISRVRDAFRLELPVTRLFSAPTLAAFAECIEAATHSDAPALVQLARAPRGDTAPASFSQHRLWLLQQLQPESPFLNMTAGIRLAGRLQQDEVIRSLEEIVRRHESLRTRFEVVDGQLVQRILPHWKCPVETVDLSLLQERQQELELRELAVREAKRPFDLSAGLLLRVILVRLHEDDHVLLISMHHIASDGWSVGIFTRELESLYSAFAAGQTSPLEELPLQYADYAVWQRDALQGEVLNSLIHYWRRQLDGAPGTLSLPLDRPRPATPSFRGASHRFSISAKTSELLREICRREGATLFMILLSVLEVVLQYETGQEDIVVGTDIANRQHSETEGLIGLFINELVLRVNAPGNPLFRDLLRAVRRTTLGAYAHQDLPFDRLVVALRPQRDPGVQPLFQIAFGLRNAPVAPLSLANLSVESFPTKHQVCVHDLGVYISEAESGLSGEIIYSTDLFDSGTITRLAEHLRAVAEQVAEKPEVRLEALKERLADYDSQAHTHGELALATAGRERLSRIKAASAAGN